MGVVNVRGRPAVRGRVCGKAPDRAWQAHAGSSRTATSAIRGHAAYASLSATSLNT